MIATLLISLLLICLVTEIVRIAIKHHKAHKFFKKRSPNLPVLPNIKLFSGNMYDIIFKRKNAKIIDEMHKKLGNSFGMYYGDFPAIFTKDVDLIKLIEIDAAHKHINRSTLYLPIKEYRDSLMQSRDEAWYRSRRVVEPALANAKVKSDEISDDIKDVVKKLHDSIEWRLDKAQDLSGERSVELDLEVICDSYTMAVTFSIAYKQYDVIDFFTKQDKLVKIFSGSKRDGESKLLGLPVMFPFLRPISHTLYNFSTFGKMRDKIIGYMEKIIKEQLESKKSLSTDSQVDGFKRRFADTIVDAFAKKKITRDDLMGNMWGIMFAGYATTADTIVCLLWQLARNKDIQEKLRKSIIENGIDADYVQWCIYETIRWHPAAPLGIGRELSEDVTVNGVLYPAGCYVIASVPSIHRDPKLWPEPNKFKPERWADRNNFHPAAFMGFGLGPRKCPGGHLAFHEIKLALEMILMNYEVQKCEKTIENYEFSSPLMFISYLDNPVILKFLPYQSNASSTE